MISIEEMKNREGKDAFLYPREYEGHFDGVLVTLNDIVKRTESLAKMIRQRYEGERPCLVCVLKGSSIFFLHLLNALQSLRQGYDIEFMRASSYHGTNSTGTVTITPTDDPFLAALRDRHVVLVEDIVDTGVTLSNLLPLLEREAQPRSLEVCTLLEKRLSPARTAEVEAAAGVRAANLRASLRLRYVGFSIPDVFVIGHGLDYNEHYRDLRDICVISKVGIRALRP